jgi:hypothetical protein
VPISSVVALSLDPLNNQKHQRRDEVRTERRSEHGRSCWPCVYLAPGATVVAERRLHGPPPSHRAAPESKERTERIGSTIWVARGGGVSGLVPYQVPVAHQPLQAVDGGLFRRASPASVEAEDQRSLLWVAAGPQLPPSW